MRNSSGDGWRALARRQSPAAMLLLALAAGDLISAHALPGVHAWWAQPSVLATCGLALVSPRRPVAAGIGLSAALLVWSAVLRLLDLPILAVVGSLTAAETGAVTVLVMVLVRLLPPRRATALVALVLGCCAATWWLRPVPPHGPVDPVWDVLLPVAVLLGLSAGAGWYLRGRDHEQSRATRTEVLAARQRERVRLARELHDVVAHHIGGMVVQAQAARAVAGSDPGAAARVLPPIEEAGSDALSAMRRMVAALRDGETDEANTGAPLTRTSDLLADLRAVTATPAGGTPVRLAVDLTERVPAVVATSVLRLVQESVTNARRHAAGARKITVGVTTAGGSVQVFVRDDGRPGAEARNHRDGYGLVGMRERVQLLGGRFVAGRAPTGGWQVRADMPLREPGR